MLSTTHVPGYCFRIEGRMISRLYYLYCFTFTTPRHFGLMKSCFSMTSSLVQSMGTSQQSFCLHVCDFTRLQAFLTGISMLQVRARPPVIRGCGRHANKPRLINPKNVILSEHRTFVHALTTAIATTPPLFRLVNNLIFHHVFSSSSSCHAHPYPNRAFSPNYNSTSRHEMSAPKSDAHHGFTCATTA